MTTVTSPWPGLGQPLFEMCWVYMAIAQIAVKRTNVEKKCSKPSWQALTPPGKFMQKNAPNHPSKPLNVPNIEETGIFLGKGSPFLKWLVGSIWALPKLLKSSPPLSVKCTNVEKKCSNLEHFFWNPNHPGKPLHPRVYIGKKKYSKPS